LSVARSKFAQTFSVFGSDVGESISIYRAEFSKGVNFSTSKVGGSIYGQSSNWGDNSVWRLNFMEIGSGLLLWGAELSTVRIIGTRIGNELFLGGEKSPSPTWSQGSRLVLRNTACGALQDRLDEETKTDSWPEVIELDGFTYEHLGGLGSEGASDFGVRDVSWFVGWLARDPTYSPHPYEQLAHVLRNTGQARKADDVLYAGRERERTEVAAGLDFIWKTALHAFIGHGYKVYRALYWILGFVVLGAVVLRVSGEGPRNKMPIGLSYSLDTLIPIVRLREYHYNHVDLAGWARYYFYFHQIMGYVLASFLIAGLSGLTK
jgi:hypothetical protein